MTSWAEDAAAALVDAFEPARDAETAGPMRAYMRDKFPFLGIKSPERRTRQRQVQTALGRPIEADVLAAVRALWTLAEREYQYAGCDLLDRPAGLLTAPSLEDLGRLVTNRSWWDTVDAIRPSLGTLVLTHPELKAELGGWNRASDIWLVRSSIIFQLCYEQRTDQALLFEMCANRATHPQFFVRKGIGWALREHAKVDGPAVRRFVADHPELSGLSQREALKRLERRS